MASPSPEKSSLSEYAGEDESLPTSVHGPPATLRSNVTTCVARSGSANSRSSTSSRCFEPSTGASHVSVGGGTCAPRVRLVRVCPRLSSTTALYWTGVPARRPETSWNTR